MLHLHKKMHQKRGTFLAFHCPRCGAAYTSFRGDLCNCSCGAHCSMMLVDVGVLKSPAADGKMKAAGDAGEEGVCQ